MNYLNLNGSFYEMGQKQGKVFQSNINDFHVKKMKLPAHHKEKTEYLIYKYHRNEEENILQESEYIYVPIKLNKFQRQHGKASLQLLEKFLPEACLEIKGITNVLGFEYELFAAWMLCMGCCFTLNRKNVVEIRGCTAFSFSNKNDVYYGRNNDLPPALKKVSHSIFYKPDKKNRFIINSSSFINGEEGINEHGLVAAMTFVIPISGDIKPGINSVFLVRYILENCVSVSQGIDTLQEITISSSCNILLVDKSGDMVVVECNPSKINIRKPLTNGSGVSFIATVNHFTSEIMQKYDRSNQNVYSSKARYETVVNALQSNNFSDPFKFTKMILSGKFGFMSQYKKSINFDTIWSTIFDICNNRIFICEGNPINSTYIEDVRL